MLRGCRGGHLRRNYGETELFDHSRTIEHTEDSSEKRFNSEESSVFGVLCAQSLTILHVLGERMGKMGSF